MTHINNTQAMVRKYITLPMLQSALGEALTNDSLAGLFITAAEASRKPAAFRRIGKPITNALRDLAGEVRREADSLSRATLATEALVGHAIMPAARPRLY